MNRDQIKTAYEQAPNIRAAADSLGISVSNLYKQLGIHDIPRTRRASNIQSPISDQQVRDIVAQQGVKTAKQLAKEYGVSVSCIQHYWYGYKRQSALEVD